MRKLTRVTAHGPAHGSSASTPGPPRPASASSSPGPRRLSAVSGGVISTSAGPAARAPAGRDRGAPRRADRRAPPGRARDRGHLLRAQRAHARSRSARPAAPCWRPPARAASRASPTRRRRSSSRCAAAARAGKDQVQRMVAALLGLAEPPESDHAADALALAICHAQRQRRWTRHRLVRSPLRLRPERRPPRRRIRTHDRSAVRARCSSVRADHVVIDCGGVGYRAERLVADARAGAAGRAATRRCSPT